MTIDEKIYRYVQKLPRSFQQELLDYVEYLVMKANQEEKRDWDSLSLSSAMRGMDDETVSYNLSDLQESFE